MTSPAPLPGRTAANDKRIAATPFEKLTARQKQYAKKYGIRLMPPARTGQPVQQAAPAAPAAAAAPVGEFREEFTTSGNPPGTPNSTAGTLAQILAGVPGATTTPPTSTALEGYRTADGQMVYVPSRANGQGYMTNGLSPEQQRLLAGTGPGGPVNEFNPNPSTENLREDPRNFTGVKGSGVVTRVAGTAPGGGSGGAAGAAGPAGGAAGSQANRDAYARLKDVLDEFGLGSLGGNIQTWLVEGLSEAEISQRLRDTDEYKRRFPALQERQSRGLPPLSPAEYVAYEKQARQLFRAAGLPQGFYDSNDDFTKFLTGDVSLAELGDRVGLASNAAFSSDPEVLGALAQFGITGGDLTAFFLDPDVAQPLLERKYNAARISATGQRAGFGFLSEQESTGLLQIGVTEGQAQQGLGELAERQELFTALDAGEDRIGRGEQLDATFRGNANARRRIEQRQRRRTAVFEQGGSFAQGQNGVSGLGSNDT